MSSRRVPSPPPEIHGFEYVSLIGSGGFSDVFLYQQQRPRRRVAVKVLLHEWSSPSQRAAFDAEADLMATLSTHPSIVTMYEADVADDGRPYLAMEYCSRPNLGARYRSERLSVAEALRIAVQVAGAVETAHRAGILHRDIKPANILVTEYGHPALTDFGISSTVDDAARAEGMSIPWSPPESFAEPPRSGIATDVWALAATTYTLLAGRSPFEVPGGSNTSADLISRIESTPLPPTGRSDVPASLERVLATAMAKNAASRYPTVLAFARALQQVQNELSLAVTPIDLLDDTGHVHEEEPDDYGGTRLRQVVSIDPAGPATTPPGGAASPTSPPVPGGPAWSGTALVPPGAVHPAPWPGGAAVETSTGTATAGTRPTAGVAPVDDTVHRAAPAATTEDEPEDEPAPGRRGLWVAVSGVAVLAVAAAGVLALVRGGDDEAEPDPTPTSDRTFTPSDNLGDLVPPVSDLTGTYDAAQGAVVFTWAYDSPDAQEGDTFGWKKLDLVGESSTQPTTEPTAVVPAEPGEQVCVEVVVVRDGRASANPQTACVPEEGQA